MMQKPEVLTISRRSSKCFNICLSIRLLTPASGGQSFPGECGQMTGLCSLLPKRIHAVTFDGLMKVIFYIFVFTINEIT